MIKFLQCSDFNFAIKRTHHRLFLEYVLKTSCYKVVVIKQCTILNFFEKTKLVQGLPVVVLKVLIYSQVKASLVKAIFFTKGLEFISAISLKMNPTQRFLTWVLHSAFLKLSKHVFDYVFINSNVFGKNIQKV